MLHTNPPLSLLTATEFTVMLPNHQVDRGPLDLGCSDLMALLQVSSQVGLAPGCMFGSGLHPVSLPGDWVEETELCITDSTRTPLQNPTQATALIISTNILLTKANDMN